MVLNCFLFNSGHLFAYSDMVSSMYLPTPLHGQDVTEGQFLSGV